MKLFPHELTLVVSEEEIKRILFHRGRMLLLDWVTIAKGRATGEFTIPSDNCDGHEPVPNMPVMRGVEVIEMAFQLLGVMVAKNSELADMLRNKVCVAREVTGATFNGLVKPGDTLLLDTQTEIIICETAGILRIESSRMIARVGNQKKCVVNSVVISAFDSSVAK